MTAIYEALEGVYKDPESDAVWNPDGWQDLMAAGVGVVKPADTLTVTPNNDIVFYRDSQHRYYNVGYGRLSNLTSVTTVLKLLDKPGLLRAGVKLAMSGVDPFQEWAKASTRGTAVHNALEMLAVEGTIPDLESYEPQDRGYVSALCKWWGKYQPATIATEVVVMSKETGLAGRFDLLGSIEGACTLADLKTGKGVVYKEHFLQLALYEILMAESGHDPLPSQSGVLAVGPDGEYQYLMTPDSARRAVIPIVEAFHALREVEKDLKKLSK